MNTALLPDVSTNCGTDPTPIVPAKRQKVLLIEDEEKAVKYCKLVMQEYGIDVVSYASVSALRGHYNKLKDYKVVLIDLRLNGWGVTGEDLLKEMYAICPDPIYIVWSVWGDSPRAQECLREGASLILRKKGDAYRAAEIVASLDRNYTAYLAMPGSGRIPPNSGLRGISQ